MHRFLLSALSVMFLTFSAAAAELIMVEQDGCIYCERWDTDIGHIYPKTSEGKFAPLRRVNIRDIPQDIEITPYPAFTPTFILYEDGEEVGRLEGYSGADFFWVLIDELMNKSPNYPESGS